jgi:hypothetical protein
MNRTVYSHKTTFAFEEACRHLLQRIRDGGKYDLPRHGADVETLVQSRRLAEFTDAFLDRIVEQANGDNDPVIAALATAISNRLPPKLLKEVPVLTERNGKSDGYGTRFRLNCRHRLAKLASDHELDLGRFLFCETKRLSFEDRRHRLSADEARHLPPEEEDPLIKIFVAGSAEPVSIVDVPHSIIGKCSDFEFRALRLYFVRRPDDDRTLTEELRQAVANWDTLE